ncbi:hypothetical protein, partial [Bacillus altitudinis]|uniref:hypothetical protein n=1 Tax=Bacillus altitudinis TaxID=293387 RepID=UPI002ED39C2F
MKSSTALPSFCLKHLDRAPCRSRVGVHETYRTAVGGFFWGVTGQVRRPLAGRGLFLRRAAAADNQGQHQSGDVSKSAHRHSYRNALRVFEMSVSLRWFSACSDCTPPLST